MADDRSSTLTGSISFRNGIDYTPNHVRYPAARISQLHLLPVKLSP
jgi:hypothetical protein